MNYFNALKKKQMENIFLEGALVEQTKAKPQETLDYKIFESKYISSFNTTFC